MNKVVSITLGIIMSISLSVYLYAQRVPYDPNTMNYSISPDQAKEAARAWIGSPNLQLDLSSVDIPPDGYNGTPEYIFKTSDGSQEFAVCTSTGIVRMWTNKTLQNAYRQKCLPGRDISTMLPKSEINAARVAFLTAKYPGFVQYNMGATCNNERNYAEHLTNGVINNSRRVNSRIDDWTGEVFFYLAPAASNPSISTQFTVQKNQAEQIALTYIQNLDLYMPPPPNQGGEGSYVNVASCFVYGDSEVEAINYDSNTQMLAWVIRVISHVNNSSFSINDYRSYLLAYELSLNNDYNSDIACWNIFVDANTGVVRECLQGDQDTYDPASVATPTFSPDAGTYTGTQTVTMSCSESGVTIRYTTDGTKPTPTSTLYTAPVSVSSSLTLKARAFKTNLRSSEVKSAAYVIQ